MIVVDSPGSAEFIEMAIPILKKEAEIMLVTVNTPAEAPYKILKKYNPERADREEDAVKIYELFNPDILAVGTSSLLFGPYVNNEFARLAKEHGKKIICFQDFWANHRLPMNFKMMKEWNKIIIPDEIAKKLLLEDGYENEIVVTGNPNFDRFINLGVAKERQWLRGKFNLKDNDFLFCISDAGPRKTLRTTK